jgi:hypothetical protein
MTPFPDISRHLKEKEGFCHPDWEAIARQIEKSVPEPDWNAAWEAASRLWIDRLCDRLGGGYGSHETANFMLVSEAPKRILVDAGNFFEQALIQTLSALAGVALDEGYGKHVVLMFSLPDDYYKYISYFYPDGEHPGSGGIYLSGEGYAHFAFPTTDYSSYRAVLVHELTHGCLAHLPLPSWLNEAMAMRMEDAICHFNSLNLDREIHRRHMQHWNSKTIQQFWSGESWEISGDSFELSYNLAQVIWRKIEVDLGASRQAVRAFISSADEKDAGEAACNRVFGISLGELAGDFLGEGDWSPKPHVWPNSMRKAPAPRNQLAINPKPESKP